jgi:hypothetical protein
MQRTETPAGMQQLLMKYGSQREVAKATGVPRSTIGARIRKWKEEGFWTELPTVDELVDEEKRELVYKHQQNMIKNLTREKARTEVLADIVRQSVAALPPIDIEMPKPVKGPFDPEEAVLLISDCQVGQELRLEETGGLGEYNLEIFKERAHNLLESVRKITSIHKKAYDIPVLNIWLLGDIVDNETVFVGQHSHIECDVVTQMFTAGAVLVEIIASLLADYPKINIVGITGNHGRIGKKGEFKHFVNWDYVLYNFLKVTLENEERITFNIPKAWWLIEDVLGHKFLLQHGDDIRGWQGLPYYGIDKADSRYTLLLQSINESYDYFVCGHHHNAASIDRPVGEKIVNGAWPGGSMFSLKRLNVSSVPNQLFFGVHPNKGITWRYKLSLLSSPSSPSPPSPPRVRGRKCTKKEKAPKH